MGLADACTIADPDHCANRTGYTCASGRVCDPCQRSDQTADGDGCVDEGLLRDRDLERNGCQLADGGITESSTESNSTTTEGATTTRGDETETDDATATSTGPAPTCEGTSGQLDPTCPEGLPFCVDQECVPCTNASADCTGAPDGDVCDPGSGACVECVADGEGECSGMTPICGDDNVCTGCTEHTQCPGDAACNLFDGNCFPDDAVLYVNNLGPSCPGQGAGTVEDPACEIDDVFPVGATLTTIHIVGNATPYVQDISIGITETVALLGSDTPRITVSSGPPAVEVFGTVFIDDFDIQGDAGANAIVTLGDTWIDDSIIRDSGGVGILTSGDRLYVRRTTVVGNDGGGIQVDGELTELENVILATNGVLSGPTAGLVLLSGEVRGVYVTIAANLTQAPFANGIRCDGGTADLHSSIVVAASGNSIGCGAPTDLVLRNSAADSTMYTGRRTTNIEVSSAELGFDADFHIPTGGVLEGIAVFEPGDPLEDIDGDTRDPNADYPGADFPQ